MVDEIKEKELEELEFIKQHPDGFSRLQYVIDKKMPEDQILQLIDQLGDNCFPGHTYQDYETTVLIFACNYGLEKVANKLIDTFGEACKPGNISFADCTALTESCRLGLNSTVVKLVQKFGWNCQPHQTDDYGHNAFYHAIENCSKDVVKLMADKYGINYIQKAMEQRELDFIKHNGKSRIEQVVCDDRYNKDTANMVSELIDELGEFCFPDRIIDTKYTKGYTLLIIACSSDWTGVAEKLIDKFGEKCLPDYVMKGGSTALKWACHNKMDGIAIKLIDTFGLACKPDHIHRCREEWQMGEPWEQAEVYDRCETPLTIACMKGLENVVIKLIDTFGEKCNPNVKSEFCGQKTSPLEWACSNGWDIVVAKLIDLLGDDCEFGNNLFQKCYAKCSKQTVSNLIEKYGVPIQECGCIMQWISDTKDKDGVTFGEWYASYKMEAAPNVESALCIDGKQLTNLTECGKALDELLSGERTEKVNKDIELIRKWMDYLIKSG